MALTVKQISKKLKEGRYHDGHGLYLVVTKTGGASWAYRYKINGKERLMGLGGLYDIDLAEARERAWNARQLLKKHRVDPLEARREERNTRTLEAAKRIDFETAAREFFRGHEAKWSNARHRQQVLGSLEQFVFPKIGGTSVAAIDTAAVLEVLKPIWHDRTVTAARVRGRIESVLDWATASGYRTGPNVAAWKGHLEAILPAKAAIVKVKPHAAMPFVAVPDFIAALTARKGVEPKALEILVLTAARSGEVIGARWSEFDLAAKVWIIPSSRMKMRRQHRVPLSDRVIEILNGLPREGDFVFVGARKGRPIGKMSMSKTLAAMEHGGVTVHGFRSSFRDWCAERTNFPREVVEQSLAHSVGNRTEMAYLRSDVLAKRAKLMAMWSQFCASPTKAANVTRLRA